MRGRQPRSRRARLAMRTRPAPSRQATIRASAATLRTGSRQRRASARVATPPSPPSSPREFRRTSSARAVMSLMPPGRPGCRAPTAMPAFMWPMARRSRAPGVTNRMDREPTPGSWKRARPAMPRLRLPTRAPTPVELLARAATNPTTSRRRTAEPSARLATPRRRRWPPRARATRTASRATAPPPTTRSTPPPAAPVTQRSWPPRPRATSSAPLATIRTPARSRHPRPALRAMPGRRRARMPRCRAAARTAIALMGRPGSRRRRPARRATFLRVCPRCTPSRRMAHARLAILRTNRRTRIERLAPGLVTGTVATTSRRLRSARAVTCSVSERRPRR
jgi:hypothetical protein